MPLIRYYLAAITWKKCKRYGDRNTSNSLLIADNQLAESHTVAPLIKYIQCDMACSCMTNQIFLIVYATSLYHNIMLPITYNSLLTQVQITPMCTSMPSTILQI